MKASPGTGMGRETSCRFHIELKLDLQSPFQVLVEVLFELLLEAITLKELMPKQRVFLPEHKIALHGSVR